jgi:hypothetical protein
MAQRYRSRARGFVLMQTHCDGCDGRFELVGDLAWHGLKRRLWRQPLYCDPCRSQLASRAS